MSRNGFVLLLMLFVVSAPAFAQPGEPAPTPTEPANEVTSLYSNAYTNVVVDTWSAEWDMADVEDVQVQGNDTKLYTNLIFAGIEFTSQVLDVTDHTHFHMDVWTPDPTEDPNQFRIKLVDFGPNGVWDGGGDDSEHELTFSQWTDPALITGEWMEFDIPLSDFAGLQNLSSMAQLILQSDPGPNTVYIDNIYFSGTGGGGGGEDPEPSEPAPSPTEDPLSVISLFSDVYDDVVVDTWSAEWDQAAVEDIQIDGNDTKLYTSFIFAGVEFASQPVDATDMSHFRMDIWFPGPFIIGDVFKIKLVDFGPNGVWDGGGDDSEHELTFHHDTNPPLIEEQWVRFDIPLDNFADMTGRSAIAQLIMVSDPGANTVYIDNVYFYNEALEVEENPLASPVDHALISVYPNPFNPATTVQLTLPHAAEVDVAVFNGLGRQVATLASGAMSSGIHALSFDGSGLASGLYFVQATVDLQPLTLQKMMLLK
jgi:Secretion system C-terminal sorting domain